MTEISKYGEFGLIKHLTEKIKLQNSSSLKGVGDDAAVLDYKDKRVLVTTDLLLEITSILSCCVFMPDAADQRALIIKQNLPSV